MELLRAQPSRAAVDPAERRASSTAGLIGAFPVALVVRREARAAALADRGRARARRRHRPGHRPPGLLLRRLLLRAARPRCPGP
jgi:hypothetical protein